MQLDLCLRCMVGTVRSGVCDHCGKTPPENRNPAALPPQTILHGRYFLGYPLGVGGFGITYAALDLEKRVRVAVKELFPGSKVHRQQSTGAVLPNLGQENQVHALKLAFEKEAKTLMALQGQPGVVQIYHAFSENNTVYYIMEFLEGEDLRSFLERSGPMAWEHFAPKLRILLDGLERLHRSGMIHRDISPDNIFLTTQGGCCLIDFGSVRAYQEVDHFTTHLKQCFAPWEQFFSQSNQGPWTDIYALCVTAYYTLSGTLPPTALSRRQKDLMVPLGSLCPGLPQNVVEAFTRGMAVEAKNRIQTVGELRALLFPTGSFGNTGSGPYRTLVCCSGMYSGKKWTLQPGCAIRFGRGNDCQIRYPQQTQGVSRNQCLLYVNQQGKAFLQDEHSSYGTYLVTNGKVERIAPEQWVSVDTSGFGFGKQELFQIQ